MQAGDQSYTCDVDYFAAIDVAYVFRHFKWGAMETFVRWVRELQGQKNVDLCGIDAWNMVGRVIWVIVDYDRPWLQRMLLERRNLNENGLVKVDEDCLIEVISDVACNVLKGELQYGNLYDKRSDYDKMLETREKLKKMGGRCWSDDIMPFDLMQKKIVDLQTKGDQFREYLKTKDAFDDYPERCRHTPRRHKCESAIKV